MQLDHRPWREEVRDDCLMGLSSDHKFKCIFCGGDFVIHNSKLQEFSVTDSEDSESKAIDVVLTCKGCGYIDTFGVAISEGHWTVTKRKILKHLENNPDVFTIYKAH